MAGNKTKIKYWLYLLNKPTDSIELYPADFGISGDTIQQHVQAISREGKRKYRVAQGASKIKGARDESKPVIVRLLVRPRA